MASPLPFLGSGGMCHSYPCEAGGGQAASGTMHLPRKEGKELAIASPLLVLGSGGLCHSHPYESGGGRAMPPPPY